jgi:HEAT repeat protein
MRLNKLLLPLALLAICAPIAAQNYTFDQVASGLKHQDPATRLRAIHILKNADYPEAAAPIGEVLGDSDDRVQLAAIDAQFTLFTLRPISRKSKVGFVVEKRTMSASGDVAAEGQLALKPRLVPPQVMAGLITALADRNPTVRGQAIGLAALLAPVACPPSAWNTAASAKNVDREQCVRLGNALIENLNSREVPLQRAAMQALGRLRYPSAVQALLDRFSFYQRGADALAALEGLAGTGHIAAVSTFQEQLANSNATVRRLAVEGLARAGSTDSVPTLQQMGQTERSAPVLVALHYATVRLGAKEGDPAQIVTALKTPALRPFAIQYLLDLVPGMASTFAESLRDEDPQVRRIIADVLGFSGNSLVVPALTQAAKDSDPDVALAAERALTRLKL